MKPAELPVQAQTKYELVINLEDRQGARPESPGTVPGARRRGDRIDRATAHVALLRCMKFGSGTSQKCREAPRISGLGSNADIVRTWRHRRS